MAKKPRKQPQAKPIVQHQLFPAVVALWFGALFGLGSLAVRPSLLESLVIASRIDLLVPAAAPPLGITARILVALILAAIGSAIGIAIARRLARPKAEVRERKRSKLASEEAPVRRPYAAASESCSAAPILAPRRRALAIEHEEEDFVPHDMAPLPGGAPQILDISSVGFRAEPAEAPLDLTGFPAPSPAEPAQSGYAALPIAAPEPQRQVFQQAEAALDAHPAAEVAAAAADGRQVFGMPPVSEAADAPKQIFGQPIEDGRVSEDFVKSAGFKTTVFETEQPSPLFPPREQAQAPSAEPFAAQQAFAVPQAYEVPPAPVVEPFAVPPSSLDVAAQAPLPQAYQPEVVAQPIAEPAAPPVVAAAPAAPLPSPVGLGMDDLSARLAASMARRRAARSGAAPEAEVPVAVAPAFTAPQPEPAAPVAEAAPQFSAPELPPMPQAFEPAPQPAALVEPVQVAPIAAPAMPSAFQPAAPAIPAAMRPLELGGFEDDVEPLDHLLPPRHIAMPQPPQVEPPAAAAAFAVPVELAEVAEADVAEVEVAEDNYASLLGIAPAPARSGFVRIEEPEAESAAIEPVVIFPGQMAQPAAPAPAPFRPFDAPSSAGQGQPVAANQVTPAVDREEADRALRMALANLQRMSGAA